MNIVYYNFFHFFYYIFLYYLIDKYKILNEKFSNNSLQMEIYALHTVIIIILNFIYFLFPNES